MIKNIIRMYDNDGTMFIGEKEEVLRNFKDFIKEVYDSEYSDCIEEDASEDIERFKNLYRIAENSCSFQDLLLHLEELSQCGIYIE